MILKSIIGMMPAGFLLDRRLNAHGISKTVFGGTMASSLRANVGSREMRRREFVVLVGAAHA